ncbi:uncharacterized protein LOC129411351 [Boleophthalmus pectinirostris]|uniref:uncharacterized protein LOC129411351 n=1 Tax=Boleophthalmus pectinirostris TaxID=150288 RepID=UPI0024303080|nr:uncharacterized protein LOC129411351 [Boleophthalmus pectinirostris]
MSTRFETPPRNTTVTMNELKSAAVSFIKVYNERYEKTQSHWTQFKTRKKELEDLQNWGSAAVFGIILYEIFLFILSFILCFQASISAFEMLACAFALPCLCYYNRAQNRKYCWRTVKECIKQIRGTISLLNLELEEVKRVCEELRRSSWSVLGGTERVNLMRLEQSVLEIFVVTQGLRTSTSADSLTQVCEEYSKILFELDKIKIRLGCYSGTLYS